MDLELSDEQIWLAESVDSLLARNWVGPARAWEADAGDRRTLWDALVEFGALAVGRDGGLGAVELCLISRALGARLASVPFLDSAAVRWAIEPVPALPAAFVELAAGSESVSIALLEPGSGWSWDEPQCTVTAPGEGILSGRKLAVEHAGSVDRLAVVASLGGGAGLALVAAARAGAGAPAALDPTVGLAALELADVPLPADAQLAGEDGVTTLDRLMTIGGLLASADAVGAAGQVLDDARAYAGERRQFGSTIGSNQALRHLLADMHVRRASAWSSVLFAAAALDDGAEDAAQTASIAKAYVARATREVAHGAMQVFGGIAFTAEHPAHRFLRRIVVRERQFGDAAHHERMLGRALAERALGPALAEVGA